MDPSLKDTLNALLARMDQMNQRLQEYKEQAANCRNLATRLDRLETNQRRIPDHVEDNKSLANNKSPQRRQVHSYHTEDTYAQYVKSVKIDAYFIDGRLDPQVTKISN